MTLGLLVTQAMTAKDKAELALFNAAVQLWADRFAPDRNKTFAYVMGMSADVVTHTHYKSVAGLMLTFRKFYDREISYSTVLRRLDRFEEAGIITRERRKQTETNTNPGAQMTNLYTVRFDRVLVGRSTVREHDFYGALDVDSDTQSDTRTDSRTDS
jgi:DNA-binding transcriptional ArsR family regulator